jgi:hypothetical protein
MICPNNDEEMKDLELQRTNSEINGRKRWKSCCFYVDREVVVFSTKYFILISLMVFFSAELHISTTCEDKNLYQSLLMLVLGISVPSPRLR